MKALFRSACGLFLAFVLASIVPVLTLAIVIREFFAQQLGDDIQSQAARTVAVAQRVIEAAREEAEKRGLAEPAKRSNP